MKYICDHKNCKVREEKNGTISLLNKKTGKIMFFNKIASFIFDNPQIGDTNELANLILEHYTGADKYTVEKDCIELLYKLNALEIVNLEEAVAKKNNISIAGEEDYKRLSVFLTKNLSNNDIMIFCTSGDSKYYSTFSVRNRQFNNQEYNIIATNEKGMIEGAISLGCGLSNAMYTLTSVFVHKDNISLVKKMLNYAFDITKGLSKIRIMLKSTAPQNLLKYTEKLGFEKEAVLKDEYGKNEDLLCYALFRNK